MAANTAAFLPFCKSTLLTPCMCALRCSQILSRTPQPLGIAVAQGHTLAEVKNVGDLSLSGDQQRKASAVLRTTYGNLKVSLFKGKVYLYDVFAEMLRVLAVQKARARSENHGLFFQSRSAVTQLTALDTELLRKLKAKWCAHSDAFFQHGQSFL